MKTDLAMSQFIYEQLAGSTAGHMSMIPNNPVVYSLLTSMYGRPSDNCYACTKEQFSEFLANASLMILNTER